MKVPDAVGHALTRDLKYEREEDSLCLIFAELKYSDLNRPF